LDVKKRFTEEQIIGFLREAEAGLAVGELCRRHGFSEASYYLWRSKFGGMNVSDAKRLKELEVENARLKRLLADALLENEVTKEAKISIPWCARRTRHRRQRRERETGGSLA
jgi:putative transposase